MPPSKVYDATPTAAYAAGALKAAAGLYHGFSLRETTGVAPAIVRLFDHASSATGTCVEEISLAPGESAREYYVDGVICALGLFAQTVSGSVAGSVRVR